MKSTVSHRILSFLLSLALVFGFWGVMVCNDYNAKADNDLAPVSIALNGRILTDYSPSVKSYTVNVFDSVAPLVSARAKAGTTVSISQPSREIPSVATITASNGSSSDSYTISFRKSDYCCSDEFTSSSLSNIWTVVNSNPGKLSYSSGNGVTITSGKNDIGGNAENMVLQKAYGDFTIDTKVQFSPVPSQPYQQGGLIAYVDDQNYVKFSIEGNGNTTETYAKISGRLNNSEISSSILGIPFNCINDGIVYMRLAKSGSSYTASYKSNSDDFITIGTTTGISENIRVGFYSSHVLDGTASIDSTFKYFRASYDAKPAGSIDFSSDGSLKGDDFSSEDLSSFWTIENPDESNYTYTQNTGITVSTLAEPKYAESNNTFLQEANGNWTAQVSAQFSALPTQDFQQAALLCRTDSQNFVKVSVEPSGRSDHMKQHIKFQHAINGTVDNDHMYTYDIVSDDVVNNTVILCLTKAGSKFSFKYSIDGGNTFVSINDVIEHFFSGQTYVGFYAEKVIASADTINVTFKNFVSNVDAFDTTFIKGDVDGDQAVTSVDALNILRHSIELIELKKDRWFAADFSNNGVVNTFDALRTLIASVEAN